MAKEINQRKNYLVHDENNVCRAGDFVVIQNCRPISARKRFQFVEMINKSGIEGAIKGRIEKE